MDEIFKEVSDRLGIPENTIRDVVTSYFKFVKKAMTKVKYNELDSIEGVKTNVTVIGFGKFTIKRNRLNKFKKDEETKS